MCKISTCKYKIKGILQNFYTNLHILFKYQYLFIFMINTEDNTDILIGITYRNNDDHDNSTSLTIPSEFAKELDIENSKVSLSILEDCEGEKHLMVSKHYREIVID
jgi:hypothetical protein